MLAPIHEINQMQSLAAEDLGAVAILKPVQAEQEALMVLLLLLRSKELHIQLQLKIIASEIDKVFFYFQLI